jgi:hypothetical protein
MSLPDFVIIGAMKCGTTTLAAQLARQDGLFMSTPKEPNFFSDDAVFARGLPWYEALFDAAPPGALKGEASTHYTKLPDRPHTIARLATVLPAPRLVYMIRDPVERAVSHYLHEWSQGVMGADPVAAFAAHPALVDYGCYGRQVAPWIERFGPGAVHLTSLEQMTRDPQGTLAGVCAFLGYRGTPVWDDGLGAQNVSAQRVRKLPMHRLLVDNPVATALRRTLVPKGLRARIRDGRKRDDRPRLPPDLRARLQDGFAADRAALAGLFPGHPALDLCYPFLAR